MLLLLLVSVALPCASSFIWSASYYELLPSQTLGVVLWNLAVSTSEKFQTDVTIKNKANVLYSAQYTHVNCSSMY